MRRIIHAALLLLALAFGAPSAFADRWDEVRHSTAYIFFDVIDSATGAKVTVQGTGFVVSRLGYILTASHLLRDWNSQTQSEKERNPIKATLGDKPGNAATGPLNLTVVYPGNPDSEDVALLKLPDPDRNSAQGYTPAPICMTPAPEAAAGDAFTAFGFPQGNSIQPAPGILGARSADGERWVGASVFAEGMSGAPVYDGSGNLIGLVKGGFPATKSERSVTPIRHAENLLKIAGVSQECSSIGFINQVNVTIMNKTVRAKPRFKTTVVDSIFDSVHLRVIDIESGAPVPQASIRITNPKNGSTFAQGNTDEQGEFVFKVYYERLRIIVKDSSHQDLSANLYLPSPNKLRVLIPMSGRCVGKKTALLSAQK